MRSDCLQQIVRQDCVHLHRLVDATVAFVSFQQSLTLLDTIDWPPGYDHHHHSGWRSNSSCYYPRQKGLDYHCSGFECNQNVRAQVVVEQFRFAWDGYYTYAHPRDDILPINNSFSDSRDGWGWLMFDALDTVITIEQDGIVDIILDYVPTVDFTKNNALGYNPQWTSLFETNIRYLGYMLGSFDLLKGPFAHLDSNGKADALLTQAKSLADALKFVFNTPAGVPVSAIYIGNR